MTRPRDDALLRIFFIAGFGNTGEYVKNQRCNVAAVLFAVGLRKLDQLFPDRFDASLQRQKTREMVGQHQRFRKRTEKAQSLKTALFRKTFETVALSIENIEHVVRIHDFFASVDKRFALSGEHPEQSDGIAAIATF